MTDLMKLTELNPRWYVIEENGPIVGLTFECPHCHVMAKETGSTDIQRIGVPFYHRASAHMHTPAPPAGEGENPPAPQPVFVRANHAGADGDGHWVWNATGDTFEELTLTPSIDASKAGHWHGSVTDGEIVGGI